MLGVYYIDSFAGQPCAAWTTGAIRASDGVDVIGWAVQDMVPGQGGGRRIVMVDEGHFGMENVDPNSDTGLGLLGVHIRRVIDGMTDDLGDWPADSAQWITRGRALSFIDEFQLKHPAP